MPTEEIGLEFRVGQLDGKVHTLEERVNRNEIELKSWLVAVNVKLDSLLESRAERSGVVRFETWIIGIILTICGLLLGGLHQV